MNTFETIPLTFEQMEELEKWFDVNIGTENEINPMTDGRFYGVFFDLTTSELKKVTSKETTIRNGS